MPPRIHSNPTDFARLEARTKPFEAAGRTDSAAMLIWFLETIYRLDEIEAQDAVCDRPGDIGIDGVDVLNDQNEVVLFQSKRKERLPGTLGDTDLKKFVGALQQFKTRESVEKIIATTTNEELKRLLVKHKVAERIAEGYTIRAIFVTNVAKNQDAITYIEHAAIAGWDIDLWDLGRLGPVLEQISSKYWFVDEPMSFYIEEGKLFYEGPKATPELIFASIQAKQLVELPGISDTRVFEQNVRLGLGKTRVNKEIVQTLKQKTEHKSFSTFHNGLTIVAKEMKIRGKKLSINSYSVCNGCQSLTAFYENRAELTNKLEVLVRFVNVSSDHRLAQRIAYRTNNQNAISLRDLSANDVVQVSLKAEFDGLFAPDAVYLIKSGEVDPGNGLLNDYVGRLLLSTYVGEPWSAHQKYKVFGESESAIFGYGRSAYQIRLVQLIMQQIDTRLDQIKNERIRKYGLTRYILLFLVTELLKENEAGRSLLEEPNLYLSTNKGNNPFEAQLRASINEQLDFLLPEFNYFITENGDDNYEYKSEFKSPEKVKRLRNLVIKQYDKDRLKGTGTIFCLPK